MTSFARIDFENEFITGSWEIKSVNHRFCEITIKTPDEYRKLERSIKKAIASCVKRGKIDCQLKIDTYGNPASRIHINDKVVGALLASIEAISSKTRNAFSLNPIDVLRWPGVIKNESSMENLEDYLMQQLNIVLADFCKTRQKEGQEIRNTVDNRLILIDELLADLKETVPSIINSITEKHKLRMRQFIDELEPSRLEQECALLISKLDVAEEIDRIAIHIEETRSALKRAEPIGRRLDFLMQELLREANTLGSKSAHADSTGYGIELKVLIEQIKEQIQNVE